MAFSSYNSFNNRLMRDTLIISLTDALTCILAGVCVFGTLGSLAYDQNKSVEEVVSSGQDFSLNSGCKHILILTTVLHFRSRVGFYCLSSCTFKNAISPSLVGSIFCNVALSWNRQSVRHSRSSNYFYQRCVWSVDPTLSQAA